MGLGLRERVFTPTPEMLEAEKDSAEEQRRFERALEEARSRDLLLSSEIEGSEDFGIDDSLRVVIDGFVFYKRPEIVVPQISDKEFWAAAASLPKVKELGGGITLFAGTIAGLPARVWVSPVTLRGDIEFEPDRYWAYERRR